MSSAGPRIAAVLVTHDGSATLRRTVTALAAQTQPGIDLIAVDNASRDGTGALLTDLVGPDRVVVSDEDLGFPVAVDLALDVLDAQDARMGRPAPADDDLVLLLHDDLELERDAVERLVAALAADDRLAIVGPKLRWADDPTRLQSVGATIDLTGRVDDGIDPGELDQGQRDADRRVLFVPTAGMLVRRRIFDELGRFDLRAHAFREDLDLCWRAAVAGYDVEVVPEAVGHHAALASEHLRSGRVAELGPRYLAERNTLAALLTNYGASRLLFVLPLALAVGLAKIAGFLLTRRIADARATLAAWGWNLVNLPGTLRRRRRVQAARRRSDAELRPLFGRVTPRIQAYLEAVLDRIAGEAAPGHLGSAETQPSATLQGEVEPTHDVIDEGSIADLPRNRVQRLTEHLISRPLQSILPPALLLLLIGLRDLLLPGAVRGGDLVPFPDGPGLIIRHLAAWHDSGATLSPLEPSPAQLVLGTLQWLLGGGALRTFLVLAPVLAWIGAMRALARLVPEVLPRTTLSLAYAASPPVLVALADADLVTLMLAAVLPFIALAAMTVLDASAPVERVWRRIAVASFLAAIAIAFAPMLVLALPIVLIAGIGHALVTVEDARWRRTLMMRSAVLAILPLPLLGPWLLALPDVLRHELATGGAPVGGHPVAWVALDPTLVALGRFGLALVVAGLIGALIVSVADVSATTFRAALAMTVLAFALPLLAWWLDAAGAAVRSGPFLLIAAAVLVGLTAMGLQHVTVVLESYTFGWRQVGVAVTSLAVVVMTAAGLINLAITGTPGLTDEESVPAYLATLGPHPPDRVLVIGAEPGGIVWEVVSATGPDLAAFGVRHDPVVHAAIADAVDDMLAGRDPRAAARLGRHGIGIILVPAGREDAELESRLRVQSALDPLPALAGVVARVSGGIPGVAIVAGTSAAERVPDPTVAPRTIVTSLAREGAVRFSGSSGAGGDLLAALPFGAAWRVLIDGSPTPMLSEDGFIRVLGVPAGAEVEVVAGSSPLRSLLLQAQAVWAILVVSLGARPPALALRNARRRDEVET